MLGEFKENSWCSISDSLYSSRPSGVYTVSQKTRHQTLVHNFTKYQRIFKLFFTDGLGSKFSTKSCLNISPRFTHVVTLPCEKWTSEKWRQCEICIAINDKSQGSIAKHLRNEGLLNYKFISESAGERIVFKLVNIWRSYRQNDDCFMRPILIAFLSSKMLISPYKLNN